MKPNDQFPGLLDHSGNPLTPSVQTLDAPKALKDEVAVQVQAAVGALQKDRNLLQKRVVDLEDYRKSVSLWLKVVTAAFGVSIPGALAWIRHDVPKTVRKQMVEPKIAQTVDRVMAEKAVLYVDTKLKPLDERVDKTRQTVEATNAKLQPLEQRVGEATRLAETTKVEIGAQQADLNKKQAELHQQQALFAVQLDHQRAATAAKSGDVKAYASLRAMTAASDAITMESAKSALSEVEMYYDADRGQVLLQHIVDPILKQDPGYSLEELLVDLDQNDDPGMREAASNSIYDLLQGQNPKQALVVENLIKALTREDNLRVVARFTRLLEKLSGKQFRPLDREAALSWWQLEGSKEKKFKSPFNDLLPMMQARRKPESVKEPALLTTEGQLAALEQTIRNNPEAIYARCLRADLLISTARLDEAERELEEAQKLDSNFRWFLFLRAELLIKQNKVDESIEPLNQALKKSPVLERFIRSQKVFEPAIATGKLVWPDFAPTP